MWNRLKDWRLPGDQNWTLKLYYSETSEERELIEIGEWVSRQIEMREKERGGDIYIPMYKDMLIEHEWEMAGTALEAKESHSPSAAK